jgi:peroxiredoxin
MRSFVTKRPVIFAFFAAPSLSGPQREAGDALAQALKAGHERISAAGVAVVGITCDNEEQQAEYIKEHELPFLLFCDERRSAVELLGVPTTAKGENHNAAPTAFAVATDGTIVDIVENAQPRLRASDGAVGRDAGIGQWGGAHRVQRADRHEVARGGHEHVRGVAAIGLKAR